MYVLCTLMRFDFSVIGRLNTENTLSKTWNRYAFPDRPSLSQFWSFKIRSTTLNYQPACSNWWKTCLEEILESHFSICSVANQWHHLIPVNRVAIRIIFQPAPVFAGRCVFFFFPKSIGRRVGCPLPKGGTWPQQGFCPSSSRECRPVEYT